MRKWLIVLALICQTLPANALPREDMDELIRLMRIYSLTPSGSVACRLKTEWGTTDIRYEVSRRGGYRFTVVFDEYMEMTERSHIGTSRTRVTGIIVTAMVDYGANGTLDDIRTIMSPRNLKYKEYTTKRAQQFLYDTVINDLIVQLRSLLPPA